MGGGLNTYGYVAGNPLRYSDRFGLLDPNKPLRLKPQLNPIKPAPPSGGAGVISGLGRALGVLGLLIHSEALGEGSDVVESQCYDEEEEKKCLSATPENIRSVTAGSHYLTEQTYVSSPVVQIYTDRIEKGEMPPPIQVDGNIIVNGNHRVIAGLLCGVQVAETPWTSSGLPVRPLSSISVDTYDWGNR